MADFVFISPSVKFNERDLTFVNSSIGITTAGLVGETTKGPAFEATFIKNKTEFRNRFGSQSKEKIGSNLKFTLPYYANSYLNESNQLFVTRILGLSGYQAGRAWGIKISAGLDTSTIGSSGSVIGSSNFTNSTFSGSTVVAQTGVTFTIAPTYTKVGTTFSGIQVQYQVTSFTSLPAGLSGTVAYTATTLTGSSYTAYENMVVALVRTRGSYFSNNLIYNASGMSINIVNATNPYADFVIGTTGTTVESYTASLNPTGSSFLPKVIGSTPKDKTTSIYVEAIYPDLISKLVDAGYAYGISSQLVNLEHNVKANYGIQYQTPETPWVVSEIRGSEVHRLFKFISISDGDSANKEIKISFVNINPDTREFDLIIRDFNDTDDAIVVLESFTRCTMNQDDNNFIGRRVGDGNENFDNKSKYVYLEFVNIDNTPFDAIPCGFEGYNERAYSANLTDGQIGQAPALLYKKSYSDLDKVSKTYLGISERAYDTSSSKGTGINQNMFNYYGDLSVSAVTKTKGFHLDSGATGTYFDGTYKIGSFDTGTGAFGDTLDVANASNPYFVKSTRKFTLVPYGGFDGWDIYRDSRTNTNSYRKGGIYYSSSSDYQAYLSGIHTFENTEQVAINLFATAGINWSDNNALVTEALDMIENVRMDSLYVIDAPDIITTTASNYVEDITDLLSTTDLDSSYAATYGPWIQQFDNENNSNVYLPPTGEVLKAMAFTDSKSFPWFAPAGLTRGVISAKKARYKLTEPNRDVLYGGRINPIVEFSGVGVDIFGQKTLQIKDSQLDRINVRRLLLYLRKIIANISVTLLFEQNDDVIVNQFLTKVNPVFTNVKRERGLSDYKIEYQTINTPESRDRNELYFNLYLKPIGALEFMGITFIVTPTGVSFENV